MIAQASCNKDIIMEHTIRHLAEIRRFETIVEGHIAYVDYDIKDGTLVITKTFVPKPIKGRGIAGELVATAYAFADEVGLRRAATCSYAATWLARHS